MKHTTKLMAGAMLLLGTSLESQAEDCWGYAQITYLQKETDRTMRCLEELAGKGHIRAKLNLGILLQARGTLLQEGAMNQRGRALALEAAEAGHIYAQFLAASYARERGSDRGYAEYWQWQRKAKYQVGAFSNIGDQMENSWRNKYDGEVFWEAAKEGDIQAMLYTAYAHWFTYNIRLGSKRWRIQHPRHWLELAAEAGSGEAEYEIAEMYMYGDKVSKDEEEARRRYELAAGKGYGPAIVRLASLERKDEAPDREQGEHKYWEYIEKQRQGWLKRMREAAELGHPEAQLDLAEELLGEAPEGADGEKDRTEARKWIWEAARAGNPYAMASVGDWYRDGNKVTADTIMAGRWYVRAWIVNDWLITPGTLNTIIGQDDRAKYAIDYMSRIDSRHTDLGYPPLLM